MAIQRFSNIEFNNWSALRRAVKQLVDNGTYQRLADYHSYKYRMHGQDGQGNDSPVGQQRFLSWHRAYLIMFERELREINDSLSIPYWDWNEDAGQLEGFSKRFGLPPTPRRGRRRPRGEWGENIRKVCETESLLEPDNYNDFTKSLEDGPHGAGHVWIGGDMARMTSPRDAAFWFHHAQVDRIWALWQQKYPDKIADLSGADADLDPWHEEFSVSSVNNIVKLGKDSYKYVEPGGTTA